MQNYYVKITVNDPYPKYFEERSAGSRPEVAIRRALRNFRTAEWSRRPLKEVTIYAKLLGSKD